MKYRKMKARLEAAQRWWDNLPERTKAGLTKPGSVKWR